MIVVQSTFEDGEGGGFLALGLYIDSMLVGRCLVMNQVKTEYEGEGG